MTVVLHCEPEGWWAESRDAPGFSAAGATFDEVCALVRDGLRFFPGAPRVSGWRCEHISITSTPGVLSRPSFGCGCEVQPIT